LISIKFRRNSVKTHAAVKLLVYNGISKTEGSVIDKNRQANNK